MTAAQNTLSPKETIQELPQFPKRCLLIQGLSQLGQDIFSISYLKYLMTFQCIRHDAETESREAALSHEFHCLVLFNIISTRVFNSL